MWTAGFLVCSICLVFALGELARAVAGNRPAPNWADVGGMIAAVGAAFTVSEAFG